MSWFKRILNITILLLLFNSVLLFALVSFPVAVKVCLAIALLLFFVYFNLHPYAYKKLSGQTRMHILISGRECVITAMACLLFEILLYLLVFSGRLPSELNAHPALLISNAAVYALLTGVLVINGIIRIFIASKQAGFATKLMFFLFWWLPVFNLILLKKLSNAAIKEYVFTIKKTEINEGRRREEVCKTKYPLLLVHGVFWRDWKGFNYWGRIPAELEANGASCFYGNHKSSASVEESGEELAVRIKGIVSETGCEKLNIIAHSKGGLDSRYAVSCAGADKYVASLTTVNTPHHGSSNIGKLIERIPDKAMFYIHKKYETLYTILGDENPDFLSGIAGLTDTECAALNEKMPDSPDVYYQSVGSKMNSPKGAIFPLNLGYSIILMAEGENDGLTPVDSMLWGNFLGIISPTGKQGISHGDMIDLTRKNIEGFDVCEFYVDLVSKLKERGF